MSKKIHNKNVKSREKPMTGVFCDSPIIEDSRAKNKLILYRLVYQGRIGTLAVLLLFGSFFMQGTNIARANEFDQVQNEITSEADLDTYAEIETVTETVSFDDIEEINEEVLIPEASTTATATEELFESELLQEDSVEVLPENIDTGSTESIETVSEEQVELLDDTEDDIFITAENATSSEVVSEVVAVTYTDDAFSFNKKECTELASGSFYCQKPQENTLDDALFSAPDADGDLEIFLVRDGEQSQISSNKTDDTAPFYDANSNSIVWQRLIEDRYQIIAYDIESGEEDILTSTPQNNMEPNRQGKYTVWQRWVDGGWNIILSDGSKETQITKTTSHNVAPYIHGSLVVWNRHDQVNERTIEMYDLSTQTYVSIEDPEGMSVSNPRMVFVYDSVHSNGDIVTKGYDMLAKKFIDLDTLPRSLPDEIPASDSTGETRALIQTKPSVKSELEELASNEVAGSTSSKVNASSTEISALDLMIATSSIPILDLSESIPVLTKPVVTEAEDLYIEPMIVHSDQILPEDKEVFKFVVPD